MSTLVDTGYPTLQNIMRMLEPNGSMAVDIANTLTKKLPLLQDMPWKEGNTQTGHRVTTVLGLPTPTWRKMNAGVKPTKAETVQYDESCGLLEDASNIDVEIARISGNPAQYRANQDAIKRESFSQELERAVFYESASTHPERIHGLTPRYAAATGFTTSSYVMAKAGSGGGTNCESVWLINWDPERLCGLYPKGMTPMLQSEDKGEQRVLDATDSTKQYWAYVTRLLWRAGLCVEDYRYACRLQWDPDDTSNYPDTGKQFYLDLQTMMTTVFDLMPTARFYMSRVSYRKLASQLAANNLNFLQFVTEKSNEGLTTTVPHFDGIPVRITDTLVGETTIG